MGAVDIFANPPIMQVVGSKELTIDGCKGIVEYSENIIKVKTACGIVIVNGFDLNIRYMSVSAMIIEGAIAEIKFDDRS